METNPNIQRPIVGIGVMLFKDGKILLGKRKSLLGQGDFAWPGGKQDYLESFTECAKREVLEETGLQITNVKFLRLMNFISKDKKHYCDIQVTAEWLSGEPQVIEPDKCEGWAWYDLKSLPEPLFLPAQTALESLKTGQIFFE